MIHLTVTSLSKKYGSVHALTDVSFQAASDIIGISGHNGSGKSTLLKCLAGLLKPSRGSVLWQINGTRADRESLLHNLGFSAPYISLYEELTVFENLKFITDIRNSRHFETIEEVVDRFECRPFQHSLFGSLSTGQQQRARLAAALLHDPQVLLLDEPGSNLDQQGRDMVRNIAGQYRNKDNKMLIIASNQKEELDLCNQIIDLNK